MSETTKGILAMTAACTFWGLSALYYKVIAHVPPLEILSHRTLWSAVFVGAYLWFQGRLTFIGKGDLVRIAWAAVFISINWFFFIYAVQIGEVSQSSLGYYVFPLVAVALGSVLLRETLSVLQWIAVGLAVIAVAILIAGLGIFPFIALSLAFTFGMYGFVKKTIAMGPTQSVFWEVVLLAPFAFIWLLGVHFGDWQGLTGRSGGFFGEGIDTGLLIFSGIITGVPLVLMSYAVKRVNYSTIGLVQYINPTLQFIVGTMIFMEPFSKVHLLCFSLIWLGLGIYSFDAFRKERA